MRFSLFKFLKYTRVIRNTKRQWALPSQLEIRWQ